MRIGVLQEIAIGLAVVLAGAVGMAAQQPAATPPAAAARPPVARSPVVDPAAHDRGRALWAKPLHRLPWVAGPRIGHGPEHHPHEDRQLRSLRAAGRERARAVPESRASDAEQEAERVVHRRGDRRAGELPAPARQRHDARLAHVHRRRHRHRRRRKPARRTSTAPAAARRATTAAERSLAGVATRIPAPVDLQQRMLFPGSARGRGGRGRGGPPPAGGPAAPPAVDRNAITVSIASGERGAAVRRARRGERFLRHAA